MFGTKRKKIFFESDFDQNQFESNAVNEINDKIVDIPQLKKERKAKKNKKQELSLINDSICSNNKNNEENVSGDGFKEKKLKKGIEHTSIHKNEKSVAVNGQSQKNNIKEINPNESIVTEQDILEINENQILKKHQKRNKEIVNGFITKEKIKNENNLKTCNKGNYINKENYFKNNSVADDKNKSTKNETRIEKKRKCESDDKNLMTEKKVKKIKKSKKDSLEDSLENNEKQNFVYTDNDTHIDETIKKISKKLKKNKLTKHSLKNNEKLNFVSIDNVTNTIEIENENKKPFKKSKKYSLDENLLQNNEKQNFVSNDNIANSNKINEDEKLPKKYNLIEDSLKNNEKLNYDNNDNVADTNITKNKNENPSKKSKKHNLNIHNNEEPNSVSDDNVTNESKLKNENKKPSKRQEKRNRYEKQLLEKKQKSEQLVQKKVFEYLSQWKYNRSSWKFEKLKQIWIFQHLFDNNKIPDAMWNTVVEYLSGAKGQARDKINKQALKIMEEMEDDNSQETVLNSNDLTENKHQRARQIIQCLTDM